MENQNNMNEIDVRKIIRIVLEHWYWFVIGIVFFMLLGTAYYLRKSPNWTTDASVSLRQKEVDGTQIDALSMLGLSGNRMAEDEVVVLSSRSLMYQAIDALNLWEASSKKGGLRWEGEFRNPALSIECIELVRGNKTPGFSVTVTPTKKGYKIKTKMGFFHRSTNRVEVLGTPIKTCAGTLAIRANRPLSQDTVYRKN